MKEEWTMTGAGHDMKVRLRSDLKAAMKEGRPGDVKLLRALISAIDQAEAPPSRDGQGFASQREFLDGSAEVERLDLEEADVRGAIMREIEERERAIEEFERLGMMENAAALRAEVTVARGYVI